MIGANGNHSRLSSGSGEVENGETCDESSTGSTHKAERFDGEDTELGEKEKALENNFDKEQMKDQVSLGCAWLPYNVHASQYEQ